MKVICDEEEEPETDIELKTSIETADVSENEIDDEPSFDESDLPGINSNPEVITERIDEPVDNTMEATEVVATEGTDEEIQTEMAEIVTTEAPQAVKEVSTESAVPASNEAPRRKFDDSRIIFSDEVIDNRNKVLATRVFIDDGLLPPRTSTENPAPKRSS